MGKKLKSLLAVSAVSLVVLSCMFALNGNASGPRPEPGVKFGGGVRIYVQAFSADKAGIRRPTGCVTAGGDEECPVAYKNTYYGFLFCLPESWMGYSIVEQEWKGTSGGNTVASGPELLIRNPAWTAANPRQDIPIMVFTLSQWNALQNGDFAVSAAPIGPRELGRNSLYVFALPPRYNFAFLPGFEEVEKILAGNPLRTFQPAESGFCET
jgi:hypothetical protein